MIKEKSSITFTEIIWDGSIEKFISEIEEEFNEKVRYESEDNGITINLSLESEDKKNDYHHFIDKGESVISVRVGDHKPFMMSKTKGHIINEFKLIMSNSRLGIFLLDKNDNIINLDIRYKNGNSKT